MDTAALHDLIDARDDGVFRVNRAIFDDPRVFALELARVFEGGWVFLGLAAQARAPHDWFTCQIGRVPVLVSRDGEGTLHALVNSCPHKGAKVAQCAAGNTRLHVCPYHSWSFDSAGRNRAVKWKAAGAYPPGFAELGQDLAHLPRFAAHRGFLFGSLNPDVPSLADHLGGAARLLDLVADQSTDGLELVPGAVRFTYAANWKLQLENCSDAYHFTSAHPSYIQLVAARARAADAHVVRSIWEESDYWTGEDASDAVQGGSYSMGHGHVLNWGRFGVTPAHPLWERREDLAQRAGAAARDWMFNMRNLTVFPNLQVAENASSQLRVIHPIAADLTEMHTWCLAPVGESAAARAHRIRQYEDFFNPSGMATPDDTVAYEACQAGFAARVSPWLQGYMRGTTRRVAGGNALSDMIGLQATGSVLADAQTCDETLYQGYYREWARRMTGGRDA